MAEVVKIDSELMKQVEELLKKQKFVYSSKKQVVNLAIIEFLNSKIPQKNRNFGSIKKPLFNAGFLKKNSLNNKRKRGVR